VGEAAVGAAQAADRDFDMAQVAVLRPCGKLPTPQRFSEQPLHQRLVAAEQQRSGRAAESLRFAVAEECLEGGIHVGERAALGVRIQQGDGNAASAEGGARQGAIRKQPEQGRRGLGLAGFAGNRHELLLP